MKNQRYISFPGKTFLVGEYAVLEGAPAILLNTKPRFWFSFQEIGSEAFSGPDKKPQQGHIKEFTEQVFHPRSPAGQWLKLHPEIKQSYHVRSWDPHFGKGGFGFSSAQFNFVYLLSQLGNAELSSENNLSHIWQAYRSLKFDGRIPSGADLISQWVGGVCLFSSDPFRTRSITWPFIDLDFFLVRTGVELNTWEHLSTLSKRRFSQLSCLVEKAIACMDHFDKEGFISVVDEYTVCLEEQGLVHEKTLLFLKKMKELRPVITAKGCGAMGAEVVAVFFDPKDKETVRAFLSKEDVVAHSGDLTCGMIVHKDKMQYE